MGNKARSSITVNSSVSGTGTYNGNVHINGNLAVQGQVRGNQAEIYKARLVIADESGEVTN